MSYDNSKQVIIRKVTAQNPTPTTPVLSVEFTGPDGVKYSAPMWEWTRKDGSSVLDKHGNKMYKGDYAVDTYGEQVQQQGIQDARAAIVGEPDGFEDSSIPF